MSFQDELPISRDVEAVLASPASVQSQAFTQWARAWKGMPREYLSPCHHCGQAVPGTPHCWTDPGGTDASLASQFVPVQPIWHSATHHCHSPP